MTSGLFMSQAAEQTSLNQVLSASLRYAAGLYYKDLAATPEEKLIGIPEHQTLRRPQEYIGECADFNYYMFAMVKGESFIRRSPEENLAFYRSLDSKENLISTLRKSVDDLAAALEECSPEILERPVHAPWGETIPLHLLINLGIGHLWYHDGQLNMFQRLYGDDQMHWLE
jgi:hypothetical protein